MQSRKAEDISTSFIDCVIYTERHFSHIKMQPTNAKIKLKNSAISIFEKKVSEDAIR
jgi:hypothetical protein